MPYRIVVVGSDNSWTLLQYGLDKDDAFTQKLHFERLLKNSPNTKELLIQEYFRGDYVLKKERLYRVYVDLPARRLVLGQTLSKNAANILYEHALNVYKEKKLHIESYAGSKRVEVHNLVDNIHIKTLQDVIDEKDDDEVKKENRDKIVVLGGLKDGTVKSSSIAGGHFVNKDHRWSSGQVDFESYSVKTERVARYVDGTTKVKKSEAVFKHLNPYLKTINNHVHAVSLNKNIRDGIGKSAEEFKKEEKEDTKSKNGFNYLHSRDVKTEFTHTQFLSLISSLKYAGNSISSIKKYFRKGKDIHLYISNLDKMVNKQVVKGNIKDALFVIDPKRNNEGNVRKGLIPCPHGLLLKLIAMA